MTARGVGTAGTAPGSAGRARERAVPGPVRPGVGSTVTLPGWRMLGGVADLEPRDGATNMAIDRALLESVAAGGAPVLRLYRWSPATLSFGRNQPARGLYDEASAAARGIDFVRRPTGGQAVLHDDELTYAVVAPADALGKPRAAYRRINQALVTGLRSLGLEASLAEPYPDRTGRDGVGWAGPGPPAAGSVGSPDWTAACFRRPERGEVVVRGRKLVGSAQRTEARTILQHGSILVGGSQATAEELLRSDAGRAPAPGPAGAGEAGWTTLEAELGRRPELDGLVAAIVAGFESVLGVDLGAGSLTGVEASSASRLRARFRSRGWTWRR